MKHLSNDVKRLSIFIGLFSLVVTTCILQPDVENFPDVDIPLDHLNSQVFVTAPKGWNTFKTGDPITVEVYVTGKDEIIFPPDFGVKVFSYEHNEWMRVETVPITSPSHSIVLPPSNGDSPVTGETMVSPILSDESRTRLLRIFVSGNIYRNGVVTEEKIGAYVDVILRP